MLFKHRLRFPVIAKLSWKEVGKNGVKVRVCVVDKDFSGLAINQEYRRNELDSIIPACLVVLGKNIDPCHPILRYEGFPFLGFRIQGNAVYLQPLVMITVIHILQHGNGLNAGAAPSRPEIQDYIAICRIGND